MVMGSKKGFLLLSLFFLFFLELSAQVGIGTTNPDASSILDIESSNKGVLIPRVFLLSSTDVVTIPTPATSLVVYNTNNTTGTNLVTPGFYFWKGTYWSRINDTPIIYGEIYKDKSTSAVRIYDNQPVEFGSYGVLQGVEAYNTNFRVITSGIYRVSYAVSIRRIAGASYQYALGFYLTTDNTDSTAALAAAIPGSFSHTRVVIDGNSNCGMSKIIHLNADDRIYLFTDIGNQFTEIMPGTANMNIELIKAD